MRFFPIDKVNEKFSNPINFNLWWLRLHYDFPQLWKEKQRARARDATANIIYRVYLGIYEKKRSKREKKSNKKPMLITAMMTTTMRIRSAPRSLPDRFIVAHKICVADLLCVMRVHIHAHRGSDLKGEDERHEMSLANRFCENNIDEWMEFNQFIIHLNRHVSPHELKSFDAQISYQKKNWETEWCPFWWRVRLFIRSLSFHFL